MTEPAAAATGEAEAPLRSYLLAKQSVADCLREIGKFFQGSAPWASDRIRDLMTRLGEDRFQLVVLGQFKRGKTSLMNAIIRRPLLPTGAMPVTSAVTSLRYGPSVRAAVRRAGRAFNEEIPVASLPEFVTERGNPGNRKRVLSVAVEVPAPFLRRGLHFVDTPGIGSANERATETTLDFLPEADVAIFVTSADGPMSRAELEFLDCVRKHVRKLFFVLNKVDQLAAEERGEVVNDTARLLAYRLGAESVRLYPVSATRALAADPADAEALAGSGFPALEGALATFLNEERQSVFLAALLDRAIAALEETRFMLGLRQRALEQKSGGGGSTADRLPSRFDALEKERRAVVAHVTRLIAEWTANVLDPALERFAAETVQGLSADLQSPRTSSTVSPERPGAEMSRMVRERLKERGAAWIRENVETVHAFADAVVHEVRPDIESLVREPERLAASLLGVKERAVRGEEDASGPEWDWIAPAFEPREAELGVDLGEIEDAGSRLPLPPGLAVRLARRRLARRLPKDVERTASELRRVVVDYLNGCALGIDVSSAGRLAGEHRRLELVMTAPADEEEGEGGGVDTAVRIQSLLVHAVALRDALLRHEPIPQAPVSAATAEAGTAAAQPRKTRAERPSDQAGETRPVTGTCVICSAASDAIFDFLCHHQYAIGTDPASQRQFLASRGLCATHTWHLERLSSRRGLCASYPSLLDQTADRVRGMFGLSAAGAARRLDALLSGTDTCPACGTRRRVEQKAAERLARELRRPEERAAFERSQWLCLPHLRLLLTGVDGDTAEGLLRSCACRLADLSDSMREYTIKHDALRRSLLTDEEIQASRQSLVLLVGERYLFRTEPEE